MAGVQLELNDASGDDSRLKQQPSTSGAEVLHDARYSLVTRVNCSRPVHFDAWIPPTLTVTGWHTCISHMAIKKSRRSNFQTRIRLRAAPLNPWRLRLMHNAMLMRPL